jgi:hypothetical protein
MNTTEMPLSPMFSGPLVENPINRTQHLATNYHILQRPATNSIEKLMLMLNYKT